MRAQPKLLRTAWPDIAGARALPAQKQQPARGSKPTARALQAAGWDNWCKVSHWSPAARLVYKKTRPSPLVTAEVALRNKRDLRSIPSAPCFSSQVTFCAHTEGAGSTQAGSRSQPTQPAAPTHCWLFLAGTRWLPPCTGSDLVSFRSCLV